MEKIKQSTALKITALFFAAFFLLSATLSAAAAFVMFERDYYSLTEKEAAEKEVIVAASSYAADIAFAAPGENEESFESIWGRCNFTFTVTKDTKTSHEILYSNVTGEKKEPDASYNCELYQGGSWFNGSVWYDEHGKVTEKPDTITYTVDVYTFDTDSFIYSDNLSRAAAISSFCYSLRYVLPAVFFVSLILLFAISVYIVSAAGHRRGSVGVRENLFDKIPFDIVLLIYVIIGCIEAYVFSASPDDAQLQIALLALFAPFDAFLLPVLLLTFSTRCKLGRLLKNTVIFMILKLIWKFIKVILRGIKCVFSSLAKLIRNIPLVWKTSLGCLFFVLVEFIFILCCMYETDVLMCWWFVEKLVVVPAVIYLAVILRKLQKGGEELSKGNLSYKINTSVMFGDFKKHGEALNNLNDGLTLALDEKMKSERLKTELITNVSHDIKTPLTSIINYVDLLKKEDIGSDTAKEYIEVLDRQSARLKKLTDDLVEASKASTGNITVEEEPLDLSVLLCQAVAEYGERADAMGLDLVVIKPDKAPIISADGKLLWRVIDNLMSNICKYSFENTRVYLTLSSSNGIASLTFRNISANPLSISPDELTERFVRGDGSRNTEGSGLGLSIAKSLTELQKGTFSIVTDGDLFKVTLEFKEREEPLG